MTLIDTHAHLDSSDFKEDAEEVIRRALDNNVWMILVGADYKSSNRSLNLANKYQKGVYAAVGLHPNNIARPETADESGASLVQENYRLENFDYGSYEKLASFEKVVAIGEIGLDYYHLNPKEDVRAIKEKQQAVFVEQLLLARSLDLPVIIHCRQAHDDLVGILEEFKKEYSEIIPSDRPWGVMHCFSGDEDLAWRYFNLGLLISFTGLITFSQQWDELIRKVPLDKIMIETDTPFMTPEPYRGKRNEPLLVQYVAQRIAEIKNLRIERIAEATLANAKKLFKLN